MTNKETCDKLGKPLEFYCLQALSSTPCQSSIQKLFSGAEDF